MPFCFYFLDLGIFDPFDMDREEFNVDMCMLRYTRECSLQNLLSRKNHVDREIRTFNGDLQNLLCDNYHKFINASTVVSGIKDNFQIMGEEMDKLGGKMNIVGDTSSKILDKLRPCEEKISKLLRCKEAMTKLVPLTDLVPTLKSYMESGAYTAAARYYLKAESVLKKYQSLPSLDGILKECREIVAEMKSALKNKLNSEIYGREELSETLNLLLSLGEMPLSVMKYFLVCGNQSLICLATSMDETWETLSKLNNKEWILREISNHTSLCCKYVERLSMIIGIAKDAFILRNNVDMELCVNKPLQNFFTETMDRLAFKWLLHIKEKFNDIEDEFLSQCLDKFVRECHLSGYLASRINVYNQGMHIILKICDARCEYHLKKIKEDFRSQLLKQRHELSICLNLRNLVVILREWTEQRLIAILKSLTCYIHPEYRCCREVFFRKVFCKIIVREGLFVKFFRYITHETWSLTSADFHQQTKALSCIVFTKYLSDLKQYIVLDFLEKVDKHFSSTTEGLCLTDAEDLMAEFSDAAQKVLEFYIQTRHQGMTDMIQKSMENKNWMESKEPTKPRAVVKIFLKDIRETKMETEKVFGARGNFARKQVSDLERVIFFSSHPMHGLPKANNIEERLLLSKVFTGGGGSDLFTKVESNTSSILTCLLSRILKSFIECIRLKTYNSFSLQQIQLDVCYLQFHVCQLMDVTISIRSLFDEIIVSAYNRTTKPKLMHSKIISAICRSDI